MNYYRIIEKTGSYGTVDDTRANCCGEYTGTEDGCSKCTMYIPRYIVQEFKQGFNWYDLNYNNLKEFNDFNKAKEYKRKLELGNDGIVVG